MEIYLSAFEFHLALSLPGPLLLGSSAILDSMRLKEMVQQI